MKPVRKGLKRFVKRFKYLMSLKRNKRRLIYFISAVLIGGLLFAWSQGKVHAEHRQQELQKGLQTLTEQLRATQQQKTSTEAQLQQKAANEAKLRQEIDDLNKQLQAKREQQNLLVRVFAPKAYAESGCNDPKSCIYWHESGNNPAAINYLGCRGLGQACPGSKLPCGNDYACQDAYFTGYCLTSYGSWEKAWQFWQLHRWW